MAPQLTWIGLGNMGRGMCKNLVEKGNLSRPLIIYNRTQSRAEELSKKIGHSTVSPSIEEAVSKSDIIFICLGDDAAVKAAIETATKVDIKDKLFVDCSTVHPDTTMALSKAVEGQGGSFVACPVFGAPAMADAGQLICVLAGPPDAVAKVKPYCTGVVGRGEVDAGTSPGKASLMKLIGNTFVFSMVETLAEGHVMAEKTGLGTKALHEWITMMFPGPFGAYSGRMLSGDYYKRDEPLFAVDLARKDAQHAMDLANKAGTRMKIAEIADEHLKMVKEDQGAKGDIAGIFGAVRKEGGLPFGNQG